MATKERVAAHGETIASFIRYVESHPNQPVSQVAAFYEVTERTIRTYVRMACEELAPFAAIVADRDGYALRIDDDGAYESWCLSAGGTLWNGIPSTQQGRISFLVNDLLCRTDWVTLDSLASSLFCSRRTVASALGGVASYLEMFGLELERRPHRGIRVCGSEDKRRICLANVVLDRMAADGSLDSQVPGERAGDRPAPFAHRDYCLATIASCVDAATEEHGFSINSVVYQNLLVHIAVAVVRVRAHHYVSGVVEEARSLVGSAAWRVAASITERVGEALDVELPDSEIAYIAIHLAGKRVLFPVEPQAGAPECPEADGEAEASRDGAAPEPPEAVSEESWELADQMIQAVDRAFSLDLGRDIELHMNLARHLGPLMVRLKYRMRLENPLCADIRARYPFAFACALEAAVVLTRACGAEVSDDEAAYLALAFALAMERRRMRTARPKNVLVVCASGMGSAELLAMRCREEFGDQLGSIRTLDVSQVATTDFSDIDYLFTTVPLPCAVPVPVREVGYFLDRRDVEGVRALLARPQGAGGAADFVSPDLFEPHLRAASSDDAIKQLSALCAERERVSPEFADYVLRRERSASTAFGNGIAIPHPIMSASERTFVCVGLADEPIPWGSQQVEVVLLISVGPDPDEDLRDFYDSILCLASDRGALARLLDDRCFPTLLELLARASEGDRLGLDEKQGR